MLFSATASICCLRRVSGRVKGYLLDRQTAKRQCRVEALEPNRYFLVVPGSINLDEATELEQDNIEFQVQGFLFLLFGNRV